MKHWLFDDNPRVAILIKDSYFDYANLKNYYKELLQLPCMAMSLKYNANNKVTASQAKEYLNSILPTLTKQGITYLYVPDSTYFKVLTKEKKAEIHLGYVLPCKLHGYEHINVIYGINYGQLIYNNGLTGNLDLSIDTLVNHYKGLTNTFGDIIHEAIYNDPSALNTLLDKPKLAIDIETTGLAVGSEIISIAFAESEHKGISFMIKDKKQLKRFFERYKGYKIFHNATFDVKQIIYNCFMKDSNDIQGLLHGLDTMCRNLHDTKIIAYLATNNTQGNSLGLKDLSHKFTGNYAVDVSDATQLPENELLEYNLKDTLATFHVFNKYYPIMLQDNQEHIYKTLMLPSLKTIIQMELVGMPIDISEVKLLADELSSKGKVLLGKIQSHSLVKKTVATLKEQEATKYNQKHKKQKVPNDFKIEFNPNSSRHLTELFYSEMGLPVIDLTDTKLPATGNKTIKKLLNHTNEKDLLSTIIDYGDVQKILSTFIPAFLQAKSRNGHHYLHGNFNLGGTLSGRLSSSNPNLQQIPSGSTFGKVIKKCFKAPKGFIFCGSDFASLEDRINALLTKDENKLKVYVDGYDGHSLRAYYYWKDQMPDITQASKDEFCIKLNGQYLKSNDIIHYQNNQYTAKEFYDIFNLNSN